MYVGRMCVRSVATCHRDASVSDIARQMRDGQAAEVVVVELRAGKTYPIGILTEQDIVRRVVAANVDPGQITAGELLVESLETALDSELVYDAIWHMRSRHIRHLVIVDTHNALIGLLRASDVSEFLASELIEVSRVAPHRPAPGHPVHSPAPSDHLG